MSKVYLYLKATFNVLLVLTLFGAFCFALGVGGILYIMGAFR